MIILYRAGGEKDTVVVWSDMVCLLNCHEADVNTYCTALLTTRHLRRVILNVVSLCCVQGGSTFISQDAGFSFEEVQLPASTAV